MNFSSHIGHHKKTCVKGDFHTCQDTAGAAASCLWALYGSKDRWTSGFLDKPKKADTGCKGLVGNFQQDSGTGHCAEHLRLTQHLSKQSRITLFFTQTTDDLYHMLLVPCIASCSIAKSHNVFYSMSSHCEGAVASFVWEQSLRHCSGLSGGWFPVLLQVQVHLIVEGLGV